MSATFLVLALARHSQARGEVAATLGSNCTPSGGAMRWSARRNVRAPGSIGASAYPSRVVKGNRSSGHMGDARITIKGLTVARVDAENLLLMIRGAVPGANGSVVVVRKATKKTK